MKSNTVSQISAQAVQPLNTAQISPRARAEAMRWQDLQYFVVAVEEASFRAAALRLHQSVNTVRAHIARLEAEFGAELLTRTRTGITVTPAGRELQRIVTEMRHASFGGGISGTPNMLIQPGEIRIGCSESIGSFWLTPRLSDLQALIPYLTVNLLCEYDLARDRSAEVDLGLSFTMPKDPEMIVAKLATLHFLFFAAESYVSRFGAPTTLDELREHKLIEQATPGVNSALLDYLIGTDRPPGFIPIRTNSSIAQFWAVANGAGIAALPTYARSLTRAIVPLAVPLPLRFEMYYSYSRRAKGSPAIEASVAWLKEAFNPQRYPWFANEFIHPDDFPINPPGTNVTAVYESALSRATG